MKCRQSQCEKQAMWNMNCRPYWACDEHKADIMRRVTWEVTWEYIGDWISLDKWIDNKAAEIAEKYSPDFPGFPYYDSLGPCWIVDGRLRHTSDCSGQYFMKENVDSDLCANYMYELAWEQAGRKRWSGVCGFCDEKYPYHPGH